MEEYAEGEKGVKSLRTDDGSIGKQEVDHGNIDHRYVLYVSKKENCYSKLSKLFIF